MKWIKRSNKREWLQRSPSLSTVSGEFCLWNTTVWVPKEEFGETPPQKLSFKDCKPKKQLDFKAELIFSIRSHYAIIHANDFIGKVDSLKDYINKLNVVKNTIKEFLKNVQEKTLGDKSYTVKRFLNSDSGVSSVYTSTVVISRSPTFEYFFEISSCQDKCRLIEEKESEFILCLNKIEKVINFLLNECQEGLTLYKNVG